ncbi:MAG: hypothetical protein KJZ84_25260 [Bryobacteraceae bacterium]|nr:hypothetical protein [Bryobacteraceae bacterium]
MSFFAISNYSSMLNRIFWATLAAWILVLLALNHLSPPIRDRLPQIPVRVPTTDFQVPLGVLLLAGALACVFRMIKAHNRLSDLFGLRQRFDLKEILLPMASAAGVALSLPQQACLHTQRRELMDRVFYKYVSSAAENPAIDRHNIIMALDQWSWSWIALEAAAVAVLAVIPSLVFGQFELAFWLLASVLIIIWLLQYLRKLSVGYAEDQIRLILEDDGRKDAVAEVFRALPR